MSTNATRDSKACGGEGPSELPLADIRIVDLTHVWSGPSATRLLAGLGADVIKIEGPRRPDFLRGTGRADVASRYPDLDHGDDPGNRNAWFNTVNTDKREIVIDLKSAEGSAIVRQLIGAAHVVIANYRPGVLDRMGFGYDALRGIRPSIIVVEMTGYGSTGPMAGLQSYGAQFDAMSGAAWLTGDSDQPLLTGFALSDPVAGLAAASAVTSAVARWRRTGEGAYVEVVQRDAMVPLLGEYVLAASVGQLAASELNADEQGSPHGIFRLKDDSWIAVAVVDEASWRSLLSVVDETTREELTEVRGHADAVKLRPLVHRCLRAWLEQQVDADALSARLQTAGVAAAPVNDGAAVYHDEQLRDQDFFRPLAHPSAGVHDYPGPPLTLNGRRLAPRRPAPTFDQDTDAVLAELGALTPVEIADLRLRGIVGAPRA